MFRREIWFLRFKPNINIFSLSFLSFTNYYSLSNQTLPLFSLFILSNQNNKKNSRTLWIFIKLMKNKITKITKFLNSSSPFRSTNKAPSTALLAGLIRSWCRAPPWTTTSLTFLDHKSCDLLSFLSSFDSVISYSWISIMDNVCCC